MPTINEKLTEEIRAQAKALLADGTVAAVIGYSQGSLPMTVKPTVVRAAEDCDKLVWNSFCVLNLANYLPATVPSASKALACARISSVSFSLMVGMLSSALWMTKF